MCFWLQSKCFTHIFAHHLYLSHPLFLFAHTGSTLAQRERGNFRVGAGHPPSQRHLPSRTRDPVEEAAAAPKRKQAQATPEYEPTEQCPEANGFYPDSKQCDKYYACL